MSPLERTLCTLGFQEPDKVPLFLLLSFYGAKERGISIAKYFQDWELVFETQMQMQEKYGSDCLYPFYYASAEIEAFGGTTQFISNGPPNSGAPIIRKASDIESLEIPVPEENPVLERVLKTTNALNREAGDRLPIIGVVMSPFSIPVMQMGFNKYLDLIFDEPKLFWSLMEKNKQFCVRWAKAQLEAGATAICYFDPISSSSIMEPRLYKEFGARIAKDTLAQIPGPTASHLASGRSIGILGDIAETGTQIVATSALEPLDEVKKQCYGKISVLGNLNGVEMRKWSRKETFRQVADAVGKAAKGGGFILSDNHGEIPYQVPSEVLLWLREAVDELGVYSKN